MKRIAIILTVFNRIDKTLLCLQSLFHANKLNIKFKLFLTDDGSTDGTHEKVLARFPNEDIQILKGSGQLYWNGGMINSWQAAVDQGGFDGYLWINNDCIIYPNLWTELAAADEYSKKQFGKGGIYVGSTQTLDEKKLSYGGFNFVNKWTLKDEFVYPNGTFQNCQACHGNITYVSENVVSKEGIFCSQYIHSGGDHDYSYLAYKHNFPVFILREFVGKCENDHKEDGFFDFMNMPLKSRFSYLNSPLGFNLQNSLLFQKRCFPYRYPLVWIAGYMKAIFPKFTFALYRKLRR